MSRFGSLGAESIRMYATDSRDVEDTRTLFKQSIQVSILT